MTFIKSMYVSEKKAIDPVTKEFKWIIDDEGIWAPMDYEAGFYDRRTSYEYELIMTKDAFREAFFKYIMNK